MTKFNLKGIDGYILAGNVEVSTLEEGAKKYGGATKIGEKIYSNVENGTFAEVKRKELSIFIPSTVETSENVDNYKFVKRYQKIIEQMFDNPEQVFYSTVGSWYSEDLDEVIIEKITIIQIKEEVNAENVQKLIELAEIVKNEMSQEAVSIKINDSLIII